MATSSFQNVRAALLTLISPISDCVITAYPPQGDELTVEDRVWISEIRVRQEKLAFGGARDEDLELDLVVYAPRFGFGQQESGEAEQRAEVILAAIEADLRSDPTIGGTVMTSDIDSFTSTWSAHESGPIAVVELTITAEANL